MIENLESIGTIRLAGNTVRDWLVALALILCGAMIARFGRRVLGRVLRRVTRLTRNELDDAIAEGAIGPLAAMIVLPFLTLALHAVQMPEGVRHVGQAGVLVAFDVLLALIAVRAVDIGFQRGIEPWMLRTRPEAEIGLVEFGRKMTKGLVVLLFGITGLKSVGFDVVSLVTGLGIGGLAVALAAQETLGNVLGSVQILTDQPFARGQFVRVGGMVGRVAEVGMRSTKLVTATGVRVVLPNKQLAEQPIENLSVVHGLTVEFDIGLVYQTTATQLREAQALLQTIVRSTPGTHEDVRVHFLGFGVYSLDLRVCFFVTDYDRQLDVRHAVNLAIKERFDAAGLSFAYPTQTLFHVREADAATRDAGALRT